MSTDPSTMIWQPSAHGTPILIERFEFAKLGVDLQFNVELHLKSEETEAQRRIRQYEYSGAIGVAAGFVNDSDDKLESALKKKMSYLETLGRSLSEKDSLPYMTIVFSSNSFTPDKEDIEKVLFGPSTGYSLSQSPLYDELLQWERRAGQELHSYSEGVFTNRRKDLLAVLVCKGHIAIPDSCEMSMWVNPYASCFRIPQSLYQLKTYTLNREIVCTPSA